MVERLGPCHDCMVTSLTALSWECLIQPIQQREALFCGAAGGEGAKAGLGVELGDADGGEFLHELVDAHGAASGQLPQALMRVVRQANGERGHGCIECDGFSPAFACSFFDRGERQVSQNPKTDPMDPRLLLGLPSEHV